MKSLSRVRLFATPWTVARQALCPWDSPGKNTGLPFPPPGNLPDPRIEFLSPESPLLASGLFFFLTIEPSWNFLITCCFLLNPLGNPYTFPALYSKDADAQRGDCS